MWSKTRSDSTGDSLLVPGVALLAVVLVAAVARGIGLNSGLWIDEIYSLVRSFRAPLSGILTEFWGDNHHPFYAVLAHLSRAVFGESAWAVRLPAMLFGVAAVPMLYALGALVVSRREALLASLLLAVSYHHVWFSQNARGYSAIAFFAIVAMWALVRGATTGRTKYFVVYGVAAGLGAYTHLTMIFVVVGHALATLVVCVAPHASLDRRALARGGAIAFGLGALLTLALYAPMLRAVMDFFLLRPSQLRGVSTPSWAFFETIRVLVLGLGAGMAVVGGVVLAAGAVVGASGIASLWKEHRFFLLLLAGPALVTVTGAAAARGTMYPRFFFFAIGPAMLLAVRGAYAACAWLGERVGERVGEGVGVGVGVGVGRAPLGERVALWGVGTVILLSAASLTFNYRYPKQDFEGAMRYVLAARAPGDRVITTGLAADPYGMLYGQTWPNLSTRGELDSMRALGGRTWVLWTFPRYLEQAAPEIDRVLRAECPQPRAFRGTVGGGDVMVCALGTTDGTAMGSGDEPATHGDLGMALSK